MKFTEKGSPFFTDDNSQDNQKYKNLPSANDENIKQSVYKDVR